MWETVIIIALVVLAIAFLIWRMLRVIAGKTACQQGICEGCASLESCRHKDTSSCSPADETNQDEAPH